MKRYDPYYTTDQGSECRAPMREDADGDYVLWEDHAAALEREKVLEDAMVKIFKWNGVWINAYGHKIKDEAIARVKAMREGK